jgi:hypothetical protein
MMKNMIKGERGGEEERRRGGEETDFKSSDGLLLESLYFTEVHISLHFKLVTLLLQFLNFFFF